MRSPSYVTVIDSVSEIWNIKKNQDLLKAMNNDDGTNANHFVPSNNFLEEEEEKEYNPFL
ncbi:hypothetical protein BpHYR1_014288 [Brachionus plicatilis]|uniref:Uncharacterized protein n=1 Tax=Brachionus plicatilis TaxID=10195 RepID=A0A3M7R5P2_BRAPC|nr:hypothetical protein BpHYR1_014288 [Brachionus plicatilis]